MTERILVIRLGALGDLVMCGQAFQDIHAEHPDAEIALLTSPAFADFARVMPWFNRVLVDPRPGFADPLGWVKLLSAIRKYAPTRVYDLQGKRRQTILYLLLGGPFGPVWSGAAPGCRSPRVWPPKPDMHFIDFLAAQLRVAGVTASSPVSWSWLTAPLDALNLPARYVLFTPGCTPKLAQKRWPPSSYAALANRLQQSGLPVVMVGTQQDAAIIAAIKAEAPLVIDLCNRTSLAQLAALARGSLATIGNDTGPMHLAAAVGAPTLALFSGHTNPVWSSPPGVRVLWLQRDPLRNLGVDEVWSGLQRLRDTTTNI